MKKRYQKRRGTELRENGQLEIRRELQEPNKKKKSESRKNSRKDECT